MTQIEKIQIQSKRNTEPLEARTRSRRIVTEYENEQKRVVKRLKASLR